MYSVNLWWEYLHFYLYLPENIHCCLERFIYEGFRNTLKKHWCWLQVCFNKSIYYSETDFRIWITTYLYNVNTKQVLICSLLTTSVKPIFPAWKALRVNSPASAGLIPGTLPERNTHKHIHIMHIYVKKCMSTELGVHCANNTRTNGGRSNARSTCHSGAAWNKNRHNLAG